MRIFQAMVVMAFSAIQFWVAAPVHAATSALWSEPKSIMVTNDDRFGGCMVQVFVDPNSIFSSCAVGWLSLGCTGEFTDPVRAYRMLDQAQLAIAAKMKLRIEFTDSLKHNGYCLVTRIDVAPR